MSFPSTFVRNMTEEQAAIQMGAAIRGESFLGGRHHGYDENSVIKIELENMRLFEKHSHLTFDPADRADHYAYYNVVFGTRWPSGTGILDIGAGESGPFLCGRNTSSFTPPRIVTDVIPYLNQHIPLDWTGMVCDANDCFAAFGANSFDHVSCTEVMEHMPQEKAHQLAKDIYAISRCTGMITSAGLCVHIGPNTLEVIARNQAMKYYGQPNIEFLMSIGYKIKLCVGYGFGYGCQIMAYFDKR